MLQNLLGLPLSLGHILEFKGKEMPENLRNVFGSIECGKIAVF